MNLFAAQNNFSFCRKGPFSHIYYYTFYYIIYYLYCTCHIHRFCDNSESEYFPPLHTVLFAVSEIMFFRASVMILIHLYILLQLLLIQLWWDSAVCPSLVLQQIVNYSLQSLNDPAVNDFETAPKLYFEGSSLGRRGSEKGSQSVLLR